MTHDTNPSNNGNRERERPRVSVDPVSYALWLMCKDAWKWLKRMRDRRKQAWPHQK